MHEPLVNCKQDHSCYMSVNLMCSSFLFIVGQLQFNNSIWKGCLEKARISLYSFSIFFLLLAVLCTVCLVVVWKNINSGILTGNILWFLSCTCILLWLNTVHCIAKYISKLYVYLILFLTSALPIMTFLIKIKHNPK